MVSTVGTSDEFVSAAHRVVVRVGIYYFVFFRSLVDDYLVYKTSIDGSVWSSETRASHAVITHALEFGITKNGNKIYVAYAVETGAPDTPTEDTAYTRKGLVSGSGIAWDSEVTVRQGEDSWSFAWAHSTNNVYLSCQAWNTTSDRYHLHVFKSVNDADSWSEILDSTTLIDSGYGAGQAITYWPEYVDGIVFVTARRTPSWFSYKTYDGSSWGSDSTFGEKNSNQYANEAISLATYNNQVHFVEVNMNAGGVLTYYYFTTTWSGGSNVDTSVCRAPSLTAHMQNLYVFYMISAGNTIYYRKMDYSTHIWDGSATNLAVGEASPYRINSAQYPGNGNIGVTWRAEAASPFNIRFESIVLQEILFGYRAEYWGDFKETKFE